MFNAANVERVIHTGDITQAKTLEVFAELNVPLHGVFGNNDQERETLESAMMSYGFEFIDPPLILDWADRRIVIVHDPLELSMVNTDDFDVILHGHTHRTTIDREGSRLVFNPGECAGMMTGYNAIGLLDLLTLETQIINF